eukprot:93523_1
MTATNLILNLHYCAVVIAGCLAYVWSWGAYYAFGVFFSAIQDNYNASYSTMAWIQSIAASLSQLCVFAVALLTQKFSTPRLFIAIGMILIAGGYYLSSYSTTLWNFYITYGVMCGLGGSLALIPSINVVKLYNFKNFGLVMGIVSSGAGIGSLIIAPINHWMLDEYGWEISLRILGISCLISSFFMVLVSSKPPTLKPPIEAKLVKNDSLAEAEIDYDNTIDKTTIRNDTRTLPDDENEIKNDEHDKNDPENKNALSSALSYLFRTRNTYFLLTSMPILFLGYWTVFVFVEPYCRHVGISNELASWMISVMGIFNVIGKILSGYLADKFGSKLAFIICVFFKGILTMTFVWVTDKYALFAVVAFIGLFAGCIGLVPKLILDYFDTKYFIVVLGANGAACAGGSVAGQPLVGWLIQYFDNWHIPGLFAGGFILLSIVPLLFISKQNKK